MALTSAMEDYLEAVLMMQKRHGYVRCVDVAEHLGVKKPSVSRAVKELSKSGHLVKNDAIPTVTPKMTNARNTFFFTSIPLCEETI